MFALSCKSFTAGTILATLLAATPVFAENAQPPNIPEPRMGTKDAELLLTKITVTDVVKSHDFYTRIVGLKQIVAPELGLGPASPTAADNGKAFLEVALNFSGTLREQVFILIKQAGTVPDPKQAGQTWLAFRVPDTRAVVARAEQAGFHQFRPGMAGGTVAFLHDPDGYTVEIMQIAPFKP